MNMGILAWIIIGLIAGWLASIVMKSEGGVLRDVVMGVVGAFVGGFVMNLFGQSGVSGINVYSIFVAALGAIIIIWIGRRIG